jgi:hypothetical protein
MAAASTILSGMIVSPRYGEGADPDGKDSLIQRFTHINCLGSRSSIFTLSLPENNMEQQVCDQSRDFTRFTSTQAYPSLLRNPLVGFLAVQAQTHRPNLRGILRGLIVLWAHREYRNLLWSPELYCSCRRMMLILNGS